jgi:sulfite reductase alpha subunit-like flavoprotein
MEERPKKPLILYATQTGNALDAAERMGREAERRGCSVHLLSLDQYDAVRLFPSISSVKL